MSTDESAALATQSLPCVCGHAEYEHAWNAQASPHITTIGRCGHGDQLPREDDEPMARFAFCGCEKYTALRAASVSTFDFYSWMRERFGPTWMYYSYDSDSMRAAWDAARSTSAESAMPNIREALAARMGDDWVVADADGVKRCLTCLGALGDTDATSAESGVHSCGHAFCQVCTSCHGCAPSAESAATCEHSSVKHHWHKPEDGVLTHCDGPVSPLGALPTYDPEAEYLFGVAAYQPHPKDPNHAMYCNKPAGLSCTCSKKWKAARSFTGTMPTREQAYRAASDAISGYGLNHRERTIVEALLALFSAPEVQGTTE